MEALFYSKGPDHVRCNLCPHQCVIREGHSGICKVRRNESGILLADSYGMLSAIHIDPVEKKPLYHFYPGKSILSLGSIGCNMRCGCCQNWQISQISPVEYRSDMSYTPSDVINMVRAQEQSIGVAYTYNEPGIWFEFMYDTARLVHSEGLRNVMVSNGYIEPDPLAELLKVTDAFNIDLKAFTEEFYRKYTGARLEPVLRTLKEIRLSGQHLEITFLVIPTLNDQEADFRKMTDWISRELGNETILHLSRYHPMFRMNIEPTSVESLQLLYNIARERLKYVYVGNLHTSDFQDTFCSFCGEVVITRTGYRVNIIGLTSGGKCRHCGNRIVKM